MRNIITDLRRMFWKISDKISPILEMCGEIIKKICEKTLEIITWFVCFLVLIVGVLISYVMLSGILESIEKLFFNKDDKDNK